MRINLGDREVGEGCPCYIICELGINANGDVKIAQRLIEAAAEAGADAVKLQKRTVDVVYSQEYLDSPRESPWGTTQRDQKEGLELSIDAYRHLQGYAHDQGVTLTASCWDAQALRDVVEAIDPPWLKAASASITDTILMEAHAATRRPLVISTGMSTLDQVAEVHNLLWERSVAHVLLMCTSTYPCDDHEINLRCIPELRGEFNTLIGYSGHERGIATSVSAVALGACIVERHLTLDRTMYGSDQSASLEPGAFKRMVRDIRAVEAALGDGIKRVYESEKPIAAKLRGTP